MKISTTIPLVLAICVSSCGVPEIRRDLGGVTELEKIQLDDFRFCAQKHIQAMLGQNAFADPDLRRDSRGRVIVALGKIENDSTSRIDDRHLSSMLMEELQKTGNVALTTQYDFSGKNRTVTGTRELRTILEDDPLFAEKEGHVREGLVAPDAILTGRIYNEMAVQSGGVSSRDSMSHSIFVELVVTNVQTGRICYQGVTQVVKRQ